MSIKRKQDRVVPQTTSSTTLFFLVKKEEEKKITWDWCNVTCEGR